jgi:hypothetical protein
MLFFSTLNLDIEIAKPNFTDSDDEECLEIYYSEHNIKGWFKKEALNTMKKLDNNNYKKLKKFFINLFKVLENLEKNSELEFFSKLCKDYSQIVDKYIYDHNILEILIQFLNIYQNINHIINWITTFDGCIIYLTIYNKLNYNFIKKITDFSLILINSSYGYYILEQIILNLDLLVIDDLEIIFNILDQILKSNNIITYKHNHLATQSINVKLLDENKGILKIIHSKFGNKILKLIINKMLDLNKINYSYEIDIRLRSIIIIIQSNIVNFMSGKEIITILINLKEEEMRINTLYFKNVHGGHKLMITLITITISNIRGDNNKYKQTQIPVVNSN